MGFIITSPFWGSLVIAPAPTGSPAGWSASFPFGKPVVYPTYAAALAVATRHWDTTTMGLTVRRAA